MRIISGSARGRTIVAPQGMDTRPTQDYVRESLFNILRADVPGPSMDRAALLENAPRAHNIALAAEKLNGTVLEAGEILSFNKRVGPRTAKNGFQVAPIIKAGEYVPGLGGGVCQASTTVYNAALLAGMQIVEYHPHSLSVGYVEPSFDAMVSGKNADLRFINGTAFPVYMICDVKNGKITVSLYGKKSAYTYRRESVVTGMLPPPEPEYAEGENAKLRDPKQGLTSCGYLVKYKNGVAQLYIPARLDPEVAEEIRRTAVRAYNLLGCDGLARVDFFVTEKDKKVILNEINTLPGFTSISMYPKLWDACGLPYGALLEKLILCALEKNGAQ